MCDCDSVLAATVIRRHQLFHEMNHELKNVNRRIEDLVNGQANLTETLVRESWQVDLAEAQDIMREKIEDRMEADMVGGIALSRRRAGENLANVVSSFQSAMIAEFKAITKRELCSRTVLPSKHPKLSLGNYMLVPLFDTHSVSR